MARNGVDIVSKDIFKRVAAVLILGGGSVAAHAEAWTLESAVQRVLEQAPERRAAEAEVRVRQGELFQSGVWPNPTIELSADNSLGKEDGSGGADLTRYSIGQRLPVSGRLGSQRQQASAQLQQTEAEVILQGLELEHAAASTFHGLQLNQALLSLAQQRLESADEFQRIGQRREQAGDLPRMERLRLDIVRETARQTIASSEGEFSESVSDFQTRLNVTEPNPTLTALEPLPALPALSELDARLDAHPALVAARLKATAAGHGVEMARANRFADPELWIARERSFLGGSRQDVTAAGIAVTVPLWDRGKGMIDAAQATKQKSLVEVEALQRQLGNRLRLTHLHLGHLIEQAQDYRRDVLEPAREIFELSRKGFSAGEVAVLNLVDAVEVYFDARARYLELLQQAWLEAAELRRVAGVSLPSLQSARL